MHVAEVRRQAALDALYPPALAAELATPSAFAAAHSRGMWKPWPHTELIERACLDAIEKGGRIILSVSVRHGKTEYARWLMAQYLATHPNKRVIAASHGFGFASRHGRAVRDILTEYGGKFGVRISPESKAADRWDLAKPHIGGMQSVGVGGRPIGLGADLLVVDDPVGSFEDAMSPTNRQKMKEWWTGTMASRVQPDAAIILIMARWHEDDLAGFLLSEEPEKWTELRLPAIADSEDDPMGRQIGEALWPEVWPLEVLEARHRETSLALGEQVWLAQYQQRPTAPTGGMFPPGKWATGVLSVDWEPIRWCRGWDLAATSGGGDFTVGALLGVTADGRTVVADVRRGQWSSSEVRDVMRSTARDDPAGTRIEIPQDPGQAGKDQAQQLAAMLAGFDVHFEPQTGSKEVRATGWAAQQQAGNVTLLDGDWNDGAFIAEHAGFPRAPHDDQVDAAATAFNALVGPAAMPTSSSQYRRRVLGGTR